MSGLLLCTGLLLCSPPARADAVARAKALFMQAEKQFAAGAYAQALELYQQAYQTKPLPGFHFNIGQCYRNLGDCRLAIEHYQQYLSLSKKKPKFEKDAEQLIEGCKQQLARQQPPEPPKPAPVAEEQPPPLQPTPPAPQAPPSSPGRRKLSPLYFWSGVGLTGALLLTGTITGGLALSKSNKFNDQTTPHNQLQGLKDSGEALKVASSVTFALAVASAAGTTALYFFTDFGAKRETRVSAAPTAGGGLVVVGGDF